MTTIIQTTGTGRTLTTTDFSTLAPFGSLLPYSVEEGGSNPMPTTFYDSAVTEETGADQWFEYIANPIAGAQMVNLNPEVATLTGDVLTKVSDGNGVIEFSIRGVKTLSPYSITTTPGQVSREFIQYTEGTVSDALRDSVMTLINSDTGKRDLGYFTTIDHVTPSYVKNPDCWARDVPMDFLSIGTSHGSDSNYTTQRPGTLITPRHIVCADHYPPFMPGVRVSNPTDRTDFLRFLTPEGVIRTVYPIGLSTNHLDQTVMTLSEDVVGCTPIKVGNDWLSQITDSTYYAGGFVIGLNKHRETFLSLLGRVQSEVYSSRSDFGAVPVDGQGTIQVNHRPTAEEHPDILANTDLTVTYSSSPGPGDIGGGDSGSPAVVIVGGEPVLITNWYGPSSGPCSWMGSGNNEVLNEMILQADADAGVSTGYTVTAALNPTL